MTIFAQVAQKIIKEQESIIGPIAREQAKKVPGLTLDEAKNEVTLVGNEKEILDVLVGKYADLFGKASVEVCRGAAKEFEAQIPKDKLPSFLSL